MAWQICQLSLKSHGSNSEPRPNAFFLDDILIVSEGDEKEHEISTGGTKETR